MRRVALAISLGLVPATAVAEPGPPCEADTCLAEPGRRPWVMTDDCADASDIVGYRHCATFGEWAATRAGQLVFEAGLGLRHVTSPIGTTAMARGTVATDPSPSASNLIATSVFRVTGVTHGFYAGLEVELGDLAERIYPYGSFLQTGAVIGFRTPVFRRVDFGAEVFVGGRSVRRSLDTDEAASVIQPVVELRGRAEVWVSPWVTLGADLGVGVLDRSEWVGVVVVGFHTRAFGG